MYLSPNDKFKTKNGTLIVKSIARRGRGFTVTYAQRGQNDRSVSLGQFRRITGNNTLYV